MVVVLLLVFLLYLLARSRKNTRVAEKYKKEYELDSATLIKYDKRSVKIYGTLTVATVGYFLLALLWMSKDSLAVESSDLEWVLDILALFGLYFGVMGTIYLGYHWTNAIFYLKRLEKYGYEMPENYKEYMILERLPKQYDVSPEEKQEYHLESKILVYLTVLIAAIMLAFTGYYFYKWSFMDEARALLVIQLLLDALWLIPVSIFYKQMDIWKYKDDVVVDITRKPRINVVSGIWLLMVLIALASFVKISAHSMTRYVYVSRMQVDRERLEEIHNVLETASYEMELFYSDYPGWEELKQSMRVGVDITTWGTPRGYFQETVAGVLQISDFGELKEEFISTDGPAVVYVRLEDDDIVVELQNLYPVTDREIKVR